MTLTRPAVNAQRGRAARLARYTALGTLLAALPLLAFAGDDPRLWLEKMSHALATRNYDGTFFHLIDGRVEAMRIVHRYQDGRVTEKLQSLEGSGREFIRNDDHLTCYLPDKHTILEEMIKNRGPFLTSLPQFGSGDDRFYRIDSLPDARVLGRPVRVIAVNPKDQYRFGYRLWIDRRTAMPLKTELCDARGHVLEQILFASLDMPKTIPDRDFVPAAASAGMRRVVQGRAENAAAAVSAFRASELPPGFHLTVAGGQTLGGAQRPAEHLVYSDGLATVSVFVEPEHALNPAGAAVPRPPMHGLARVGSGFAFATVVEGRQITAVGEVPAATLEFIAHSVKAYGGGARPPDLPRR